MKCYRAHGLGELWSCSDEWNVIGQAERCPRWITKQMLRLLRYVWICMFVDICVALIDSYRVKSAAKLALWREKWRQRVVSFVVGFIFSTSGVEDRIGHLIWMSVTLSIPPSASLFVFLSLSVFLWQTASSDYSLIHGFEVLFVHMKTRHTNAH